MKCSAGISFKPDYIEQAVSTLEQDIWFEVHTENYLVDGGTRLEQLEQLAQRYPISFHGVSASLGSGKPISTDLLAKVKNLIDIFQPSLVSEHATWCRNDQGYIPDLLPLPRTNEMMSKLTEGVSAYQDGIQRSILLENPTNYLNFQNDLNEPDFLIEVAKTSGCGLLLDLNNVYLSSINCGIDAHAYIDALPDDLIGEIHIAGFTIDPHFGDKLLIDSHAEPVSEPVWKLLDYTLKTKGQIPVLIERDDKLPEWNELIQERNRAQALIVNHCIQDDVA